MMKKLTSLKLLSNKTRNDTPLKVAVIGVGNMGRHHVRNYFEMPNVELIAAADLDEKRGELIAKKYKCEFYKDYRKMLNKKDIDAVSVVVPTSLHEKVSLDVINFGKHVLVEKPLAHSVQAAKKIIQAAQNSGVKLAVGHVERFNSGVIKLKELMTKKELGDILAVSIKRVGLPWPKRPDTNVISDLAIHDIDILYYFFGIEPDQVWAYGGKSSHSQEDYAKILLTYRQAGCSIEVNWKTPVKIRKIEVTGSSAYAELDLIKQKLVIYRGIKKSEEDEDFYQFVRKWKPKAEIIDFQKKEPLRLELESFLDCIIKGRKPLVDGEDGLRAVKLSEKITSIIRRKE